MKIFRKFVKWFLNDFIIEKRPILYKKGSRCYSNTLVDSLTPQMVEIGDNFISAPGSIIVAHDASTFLFSKKYRIEKVIIGSNVFLGANSTVLPGVNIGNNVIIGAGSVVTKDIPSDSVVVGNPARIVSSVNDYIEKCIRKEVLYDVPPNFLKEYEYGIKFSQESLTEFQEYVLFQYRQKTPKNRM